MALKKTYDTEVNYETTDLNSLADATGVVCDAIDNTTNSRYGIKLSFDLASIDLSAQDNPAVYFWLLATGTDMGYEDGSASIDPARPPDLILPLREVSAAQQVIGEILNIPATFKVLIHNATGAAWTTGNTLDYELFTYEDA